jgi:serine/threonine-protein kinase RsbW
LKSVREPTEMIRMLDERTVAVSLPNKFGYERVAMDCSASLAKIAGLGKDRIEDLKTAVSEACLNAIEHGNKGRTNARVIVTMDFKDDTFSVSVMDEGKGIPEMPQSPDIDKKIEELETPRGLGIYLMKQLTDQVEFNAEGDGHVVRMVIKLRG